MYICFNDSYNRWIKEKPFERKERNMEPGYRYRWTHMRESMGLTPPFYVDDPIPNDDRDRDQPDLKRDLRTLLFEWLVATGIAVLVLASAAILVP